MGPAIAAALMGLALGAPGDLRLELALGLDGQGRSFAPRDGPADRTVETVTAPRATLHLAEPDLGITATYAPRLRTPDLQDRRRELVVLHAGELQASFRPADAWRLAVTARGELGTTDLLTESRQAGATFQTIATTRRLRYQAARALLDLQGRLGRRTTLTATLGGFVEGGEGSAAETIFPIQRGVSAGVGWAWAASRVDRLGLRVNGAAAWLDRGPASGVVTLDTTWRRRLTRELEAWSGVGAAGGFADPRPGPVRRRAYPAAELGVAHTPLTPAAPAGPDGRVRPMPAYRITTQAVLRFSPVIDRATGAVDPQLEGTLSAAWPVTPRWGLDARAVGAVLRQTPGDTRSGRLEARTGWIVAPHVRIGGGLYATWQRGSTPAIPSFTETGLFLGIQVVAPPIAP